MLSEPQGKIVTFYSYKGGTGRTMALANVACLLARNQTAGDVLMIDWDLEAPGLHQFFRNKFQNQFTGVSNQDRALDERLGLLDLFRELNETICTSLAPDEEQSEKSAIQMIDNLDLERFTLETDISHLYLLKAGQFDGKYAARVSTFQWEELYNRSPWLISAFATRLAKEFRYVLIDSRTGLSDTSGICTMLMPEKLVVVFTPNFQSLTGILGLIRRATNYRRHSNDLRPLVAFPLPSRIDMSEDKLRELWRYEENSEQGITGYQKQFEELFEEVYDLPECDLEDYLNEVQIQHVPRYAYGEEIAVLVERGKERLSLTRSYENFTERLVELIGPWEFGAIKFESIEDIERELISVLERIPGMENPEIRDYLLSGFSSLEINILSRSSNTRIDLVNIVNRVGAMGKLDVLLENAMSLTQSQENVGRLRRVRRGYQEYVSSKEKLPPRPKREAEFDVLLIYNSQDKSQVRAIAEELKQRGLRTWLDTEQIPPGRSFQDAIQKAITTAKSAAIFIGPKGLGKWATMELRAFVARGIKADLPMIPVLLPGVNDVPKDLYFLKELNWLRLSSGIDDTEALDNLEWGITGKHPRKS